MKGSQLLEIRFDEEETLLAVAAQGLAESLKASDSINYINLDSL